MSRSPELLRHLAGHIATIAPTYAYALSGPHTPASVPWSTRVAPGIRVTGALSETPGSDTLVVLAHGVGSCSDAWYMRRAAWAAHRAGVSSLRLSFRGCDRRGDDLYHAALTADLHAAVEALPQYRRVLLFGWSLGGNTSLFASTEDALSDRVHRVAAVCAPLLLDVGSGMLDRRRRLPYRRHVLAGLKQVYEPVARRGRAPTPWAEVAQIRTLRDWDAATVVPRFGFRDVDDYYTSASSGGRLSEVRVPALVISARHDPMVPYEHAVRPALERDHPRVTAEVLDGGGHVYVPSWGGQRLEARVLEWLLES